MLSKFIAAVALIASTAGALVPSAALARDRDYRGWQGRGDHSKRGYGGHGYNQGGRHDGYNSGAHYAGNRYFSRGQGYERQHAYDRGYSQPSHRGHGYRGH